MDRAIELSEAAEIDHSELARFLSLVHGPDYGVVESWFDHWWRLNPSWSEQIPRGWLLRSPRGAIIAFTANIPLPYIIAGERRLFYTTGSTSVHPEWRGKGLSKPVAR